MQGEMTGSQLLYVQYNITLPVAVIIMQGEMTGSQTEVKAKKVMMKCV